MNRVEFPNLAPSVCFLCEKVDALFYVDTLRTFDPGGPTPLTGRKYVCSNCIIELNDCSHVDEPAVSTRKVKVAA